MSTEMTTSPYRLLGQQRLGLTQTLLHRLKAIIVKGPLQLFGGPVPGKHLDAGEPVVLTEIVANPNR